LPIFCGSGNFPLSAAENPRHPEPSNASLPMKTTFAPGTARRGFTLIELLVVVTIIAILAAGAYAGYSVMIEKAKVTDARSTGLAVTNAIEQYQMDYDYLPQPISATAGTDCNTDTSAEEGLIAILKGVDVTQNSRKKDYLGDIKEAKTLGSGTSESQKRVNGIYRETEETIALYDPWGSFYKVILDLDGNKKIENPNTDPDSGGSPELHKEYVIYSLGKDESEETWKDNVTSWQQ
jgi:prepilin-type N-terminal cleavage/methylation domain-containing protein